VITGWQYTLWDLIPWAKGELVTFTTVVGVLILTLLDSTFRQPEEVEQLLGLRPVATVPKLMS